MNVFIEKNRPMVELKGTENLPIKDRVILHLRLLKYLKQGLSISKAVKLCQKLIPVKKQE